ncbi:MAG: formate dehydrogenase [Burkholderiaceae bacterium]
MSIEKVSRRKFFSTVVVGGVATATTAIAATLVGQRIPGAAQAAEPRPAEGYRETAHIKNYYRSTLV